MTYRWNSTINPVLHELHSRHEVQYPRPERFERRVSLQQTFATHVLFFTFFGVVTPGWKRLGIFLSVKCNFDRLSNHFGFCPCVCVCLSTDRLSNDYVRNSLPIFTKFCMPLRNVVVSKAIVSRTNWKLFTYFRDVQSPISAVFRLWWTYFLTDRHKNLN